MKGEFTVLTEAVQVKIKQLIIDGVLRGEPKALTFKKIRRVIENYAVNCPKEIRASFVKVLWQGALKLYPKFKTDIEAVASGAGVVVLMLGGLLRGEHKAVETAERGGTPMAEQLVVAQENIERRQAEGGTVEDYTEYIYPNRIDIEDVRKKVKTKIRELSETETESGDGHSLRNRAEMYVRHEAQQESIEQMRKDGIKLVWASTHADCSRRCAPWQGKLYSLDGTYGEINGKSYQPLENATDIWYTTRAGRRWKNGLLGFNCRHRLVPYNEHQAPPKAFSAKEIEVRRALNERQRALERGIRKQRALAWEIIHQDGKEAQRLFAVAKRNEERYREFCRKNNLVALPYRTQVMREEM